MNGLRFELDEPAVYAVPQGSAGLLMVGSQLRITAVGPFGRNQLVTGSTGTKLCDETGDYRRLSLK